MWEKKSSFSVSFTLISILSIDTVGYCCSTDGDILLCDCSILVILEFYDP